MKRTLTILAAAVALLALPAVGHASVENACPAQTPESQYSDVRGTTHAHVIDCLAWWAVDIFGGSGTFHPARNLTRAEHAATLSHLLDASDREDAGSTEDQGFEDIDGHRYEAQINRLASLDVINGRTPTRFDPEGPIRRDQMASLIVRLHERVFSESIKPGEGFSDTDGNVHEENIRKLVATGITQGKTEDRYDPEGSVTRGQIAAFTMRHGDLLVELGLAVPPQDFDAITLSGVGDDVIDVAIPNDALAVADLTHDGESNFAIWTYNREGEDENLIVNEIGPYTGTVPVNFEFGRNTAGFDVTADGAWNITLRPASKARWMPAEGGDGAGASFVRAGALAGGVYDITHDGDSNFTIWAYDGEGQAVELVANEIGAYDGTQRIPAETIWLEIDADGNWMFTPSS